MLVSLLKAVIYRYCIKYPWALSHYTAITRSWRGDVKFLRAPWDRRNMQKIVAYYSPFSQHGDVTATLRRLWHFYGDSTECYRVPAEFLLSIGCALAACSRRAMACTLRFRSGYRARTASTPRWRGPINSTPFCCGWRTLVRYALLLVLIDEGLGRLAHFTNTHRHGIVRDSKVILLAGVPVPGGQLNKWRIAIASFKPVSRGF